MPHKPRLFFHCYDHQRPRGGQLDTYRQVETLCAHGYEAYVFHDTNEFRPTWFDTIAPVLSFDAVKHTLAPDIDVVVLPEDLGSQISYYPGKKVIFNKGVTTGFAALRLDTVSHDPYRDPSVLGVMTISDHNSDVIRLAYPTKPVYTMLPFIDWPLFDALSNAPREKTIIASVQKGDPSLLTLCHILQSRANLGLNSLHAFSWITLATLPHREYARLLNNSMCLLFLSEDEGLGRAPLEAIAAGCIPLIYDGCPLARVLPRAFCYRHGDYGAMVTTIEELCEPRHAATVKWRDLINSTNTDIRTRYSLERYTTILLTTWQKLLSL